MDNRTGMFAQPQLQGMAGLIEGSGRAFPASSAEDIDALVRFLANGATSVLAGGAAIPAAMGSGGGMAIPLGLLSAGTGALAAKAGGEIVDNQNARKAYNNEFGPNNQMPMMMTPNGPVWR